MYFFRSSPGVISGIDQSVYQGFGRFRFFIIYLNRNWCVYVVCTISSLTPTLTPPFPPRRYNVAYLKDIRRWYSPSRTLQSCRRWPIADKHADVNGRQTCGIVGTLLSIADDNGTSSIMVPVRLGDLRLARADLNELFVFTAINVRRILSAIPGSLFPKVQGMWVSYQAHIHRTWYNRRRSRPRPHKWVIDVRETTTVSGVSTFLT